VVDGRKRGRLLFIGAVSCQNSAATDGEIGNRHSAIQNQKFKRRLFF